MPAKVVEIDRDRRRECLTVSWISLRRTHHRPLIQRQSRFIPLWKHKGLPLHRHVAPRGYL